ncbi:MAG: hypothetical protein AAFY15_10800 [Cyanobacteria bacterium J06648_11]
MTSSSEFSALQLRALGLAWKNLNCDWDADCLMNELLAAHYPTFEAHRNAVNPTFALQRREEMLEQFIKLCILQGWDTEDKLDWYEQKMRGPIEFRNLLGFRESYAGRYFDRDAIGLDTCDAIFQDVNLGLEELEHRQLACVVGKIGLLLTADGIDMARVLFPDVQPRLRGNPYRHASPDSVDAIAHQRRSPEWRAKFATQLAS